MWPALLLKDPTTDGNLFDERWGPAAVWEM